MDYREKGSEVTDLETVVRFQELWIFSSPQLAHRLWGPFHG